MSTLSDPPRVIPAQVEVLAIYNPSLSTSDETLRDQILFYHARRGRSREKAKDKDTNDGKEDQNAEAAHNEQLRQIGIAQGMIEFAKNFSTDPIDFIDTEKSRVIVHELEPGWWILASIRLTRLPPQPSLRDGKERTAEEYSAREVGPAPLLIAQLQRANAIFLLHHAATLQELWNRSDRAAFCALLERYWNEFVSGWDVLLHGNPAVDVHYATKLSGGGELGFGVGEEEWGSGEREVLEGFIDRTDGLKDLIVGRYGPSPPDYTSKSSHAPSSKDEHLPWLGQGEDAAASDGVIFTGKGLLSKKSLTTVSAWMEAIFKDGERAYGVTQNPTSRARQQRTRRPKPGSHLGRAQARSSEDSETHPRVKSPRRRHENLRKQAIENNATPPGIPPPLVGQVERSLNEALAKADKRTSSKSPRHEKSEDEALRGNDSSAESSTSTSDTVVKYLTLGYGTAWTLNPKGFKQNDSVTTDDKAKKPVVLDKPTKSTANEVSEIEGDPLNVVDPTPEVSDEEQPAFVQYLEQSIGKFLIGLSGDLEQTELDNDTEDRTASNSQRAQRVFLRTLNIESAQPHHQQRSATIHTSSQQPDPITTFTRTASGKSVAPTSAGDSVDGSEPNVTFTKVQVAVYVHQPFIFVFLFELHTPSLTIPSFYRSIHNQLGPLQKPLLRSTDPTRTTERLLSAIPEDSSVVREHVSGKSPIYDLIYDPNKQTIRTSIPNIPAPGSLAAEGLTHKSSLAFGPWYTLGIPIQSSTSRADSNDLVQTSWSRIDALNVHTQVLNTIASTRSGREFEQVAKTGRGWWVLWMKVVAKPEQQDPREAILVRKAADNVPSRSTNSSGAGRWLLRDQPRDVSGSGSADSNARSVGDGVGVDAKKWVDCLLHLTS